jgi:hypothetical protein
MFDFWRYLEYVAQFSEETCCDATDDIGPWAFENSGALHSSCWMKHVGSSNLAE